MDNDLKFVLGLVTFLLSILLVAIAYAVGEKIAERQCLEAGYPVAHNTYAFETYCTTLDGTSTVKLTK